jgi:hypothetical protein
MARRTLLSACSIYVALDEIFVHLVETIREARQQRGTGALWHLWKDLSESFRDQLPCSPIVDR